MDNETFAYIAYEIGKRDGYDGNEPRTKLDWEYTRGYMDGVTDRIADDGARWETAEWSR